MLPERRHGSTREMSRPALLDFSDGCPLYTFTKYQKLELPAARSLAATARAGGTVGTFKLPSR
jgi:hypothetical protein